MKAPKLDRVITTQDFINFMAAGLKIKVIDKDNPFFNEEFPVLDIGRDYVTCDVLHHAGTESFDFTEIKIIRDGE